jgi:hypothetical protein
MKQVIYSEHHRGIVEYPLLTEPKKMDYVRTGAVGAYVTNGFVVAIEIYNKWLSSPPIAQVRDEDIEFANVQRPLSDYEIVNCEWCEGEGWFINEEHKDFPKKQQKLDCFYCNATGKVAIPIKEADYEPSQLQLGKSVASHSSTSLSLLDKWALQNIVDAEQEFKNETNPECKQFLNGVIAALQDVRTHIADSNKKLTPNKKLMTQKSLSAGDAWKEYIKQYPKLDEFWKSIPEATNTWLSQQIDIFAGKYPVKEKEDVEKLAEDSKMLDWIQSIMTNDDDYCEIFFAGLRNGTGKATAFQIESNPEKFKTVNAPTLRDVILKAMSK